MLFRKRKQVHLIAPDGFEDIKSLSPSMSIFPHIGYNLVPLTGVLSLDENPKTVEIPAFTKFFIEQNESEDIFLCTRKNIHDDYFVFQKNDIDDFYLSKEIVEETIALRSVLYSLDEFCFKLSKNRETITFQSSEYTIMQIFLPLYSIVKCAYPEAFNAFADGIFDIFSQYNKNKEYITSDFLIKREIYSSIAQIIKDTRQTIIDMGGFKQYDNYSAMINFIYRKLDEENKQREEELKKKELTNLELRKKEENYSKFKEQLNSRMELIQLFKQV